MSQTVSKFPVIDFSNENLKPGTNLWLSTCKGIRQALEEQGWFIAIYDKVSLDLHNTIFSLSKELLDLPYEKKIQNINHKPSFGYMGKVSVLPLHESMGIDNATTLEACQNFTKLMWPSGNDHFCETANSYAKAVAALEQMVMRMVLESYGIEKYHDSHIHSFTYLLRFLKYRRPETHETNVAFVTHTDKSFISILHQNHVRGLELRTKDGEWISFEPSPSSFVVIAGDACMAWSNERIRPGYHRVIMKGYEPRYSLGVFSFHSGVIQTPEELVDDEHPLQYKPFDHVAFLRYYDTSDGRKSEHGIIKTYCGA